MPTRVPDCRTRNCVALTRASTVYINDAITPENTLATISLGQYDALKLVCVSAVWYDASTSAT